MKNTTYWPTSALLLGIMLGIFSLFPAHLFSQCSCGSNLDINPGNYGHHFIPEYDANGFVSTYPLFTVEKILHGRVERGISTTIKINNNLIVYDLFIGVKKLEPCKTYEMRVTCPNCPSPDFYGFCHSGDQVDAYFNDENNTLENVSQIWEVCYSPIKDQAIENLVVSSVDAANNSIKVKWDHLHAPATYTVEYKKPFDNQWIIAGTTSQYEFELNNLEACATYMVRARGNDNNCCNQTNYSSYSNVLKFVMTDCMSNIKRVDLVTGNSAHVSWDFIGSNTPPLDYLVKWWRTGTLDIPATATVTSTDFTIIDLLPYTGYSVQVESNCGAQTCQGISNVINFTTNCELSEPNNSFQTAVRVGFDANYGNVNISPAGDVDYYKFIPTSCQIEIMIDHPDWEEIVRLNEHICSVVTGLPYTLYDQNFQEVPKITPGYIDDDGCSHNNIYWVIPGQEYYIAIRGVSYFSESLNCYTFKVFPCVDCDMPIYALDGADNIYETPSTAFYLLQGTAYQVDWSVSGPADIIPTVHPNIVQLSFYEPGTVVLTATVTHCDGTTETVQKEIVVTDECNIVGSYTNSIYGPALNPSFNFVKDSKFTITLEIPEGCTFYVYLEGGNADWSIDGNQIIVNLIATNADWRGDSMSHGNPTLGPVTWTLSPNPTNNLLQINPVISPNVDATTVPEAMEMWLFSPNASLEVYQQGSTRIPNSLNMTNLTPGNYTLQLLYGTYLEQFTVVKQ